MSLHTLSIAELSAGLAAGQFSSVELTQHFLARIGRANGHLNAYLEV
jgi:aspartyl-tRNA(Asn)/glutamyl-tRNA(Gln) amidotransferase subunit A